MVLLPLNALNPYKQLKILLQLLAFQDRRLCHKVNTLKCMREKPNGDMQLSNQNDIIFKELL